ncbi:hypothetical protein SAMN05216567_111224 [Variovorax sp. OK605]|uniref:hypothetical protein n=1 Tax=Variovorax sp. OK605 TaxID=1855317 RepID=UPI0008E49603|nr:hypothetical protein [Variovorax sp. OK605]SFQ15683.1 hypothetical protein SAMN05216567_111224 [Variovorax sp. OK605]
MAALVCRLLLAFALLSLAGCVSVTHPNLGPASDKLAAYDSAPSLSNAIAVGASMRDRYAEKIESQIAWERGIGVGLIGVTGVAADLAMRGVAKSEILGLGLAGAALYTGGNWLFSKPQQMIYAAGASAVQCALDVTQPFQLAEGLRPSLRADIAKIRLDSDELQRLLGARSPTTPGEKSARGAIDRAKAVLPAAQEMLAALDGAGVALRSSLSAIQLQVTNAYLANSPNLQGLVEALGKSLPATGSKIIGVSLPPMPQVAFTAGSAAENELANKAKALDALVSDVAKTVASLNLKPGDDKLRLCSVDLKQAGLAMKLAPAGALTVRPGGAATVVVSGGVLPYRAEWIGQRPPDGVSLKVESGQGFITVEAKGGVTVGSYQLLVLDAGQGRESVDVAIGGSGGAQPPASPNTRAAAATPDPKLRKVQQVLIDKGITTVKVDGKDEKVLADGQMGKISIEAMRQFMRDQGAHDDQIPKRADQLLAEVASMLVFR